MRIRQGTSSRTSSAGQSVVELALIMPLLLVLTLGVADLGRALLFNNILINMSREGANLASRTAQSPTFIIDTLNQTAAPLDMATQGMGILTRVKAVDGGSGTVITVVVQQVRAVSGKTSLASKLWVCPSWASSGACNLPVAEASRVVTLPFTLALGFEVNVMETLYDYVPLTNFVLNTTQELYARTLL
jgi:Flp pilus assembly protein TadG